MINPCVDLCYTRYGKQYSSDCDDKCEYAKAVKERNFLNEELNTRKIAILGELASQFCCLTECEHCPVMIHGYERRTKLDKEILHEPCCTNLYKWIIEKSKEISRS